MADGINYIETELLEQIAKGDQAAFRVVYDRYRNKLFSIACKILKEEHLAEDAVQEVFTTIWLHRKKLLQVNNLDAYLNTITRNHLFNQLKRMAFAARYIRQQQHKVEASNPVMERVEYNERYYWLAQVVDNLSPQQKKVYHLGKEEGLRYEEIALKLQISRETVKTHMACALRVIKTKFREQEQVINKFIFVAVSAGFLFS